MIAVAFALLACPNHGRRLQLSNKQPLAIHPQAAFDPCTTIGTSNGIPCPQRRTPLTRRPGHGALMRSRTKIRAKEPKGNPTKISPKDTERLSKALQRVRDEAPLQGEVIVALEMLTRVALDVREAMDKSSDEPCLLRPYKFSGGRLQPSGQPTRLAEANSPLAVALIGTDKLTHTEKESRLIALGTEALQSGRPRSAWTIFNCGIPYLAQSDGEDAKISSRFILGGLLAAIALRNETKYNGTLAVAQEYMVDLRDDDGEIMSEVMAACCGVGWLDRASSINSTLVAAGLTPTLDAVNAFMGLQLRLNDTEGIIRTFEYMKKHGPKPDSESYAFATQAAARREGWWSKLHNAMQRNELNIPWNQQSASAAYSEFVQVSKFEEAVRVTNWMEYQKTRCSLGSFEELLYHASVSRSCAPTTLAIYEAMKVHAVSVRAMEEADDWEDEDEEEEEEEENEPPISASTLLLVLPHVPPTERIAFCEEALSKDPSEFGWLEAEDNVKMQAALALIHAANGNGRECASWLTTLHKEGVSLETLDADGSLTFAMQRMQSAAKSPLDEFEEILEDSPVDLETAKLGIRLTPSWAPGRKVQLERFQSLWLQALRACNDPEAASEILKELRSCGDLPPGLGAEALLEYLGVCNRACDAQKAWDGLTEFDELAPVEAFLSALMTCCSGETPNIDLSLRVVVKMQRSWAFIRASPAQLLTMYVCLVKGHGQQNLDKACEVFASACAWIIKERQKKVRDGWTEDDWLLAKYAVYRTMVEVAAPKDTRGLLFAIELCDQLEREDDIQLDHALFTEFLEPCKNPQEMEFLAGPLLLVNQSDPLLRPASLGTVSAIMAALKKSENLPPVVAVYKLFEAGVRLEESAREMFKTSYDWIASLDQRLLQNPRIRANIVAKIMAWDQSNSNAIALNETEIGFEKEQKLLRIGNSEAGDTQGEKNGKSPPYGKNDEPDPEPKPKARDRRGKWDKRKQKEMKMKKEEMKKKEKDDGELEEATEPYQRPRFR